MCAPSPSRISNRRVGSLARNRLNAASASFRLAEMPSTARFTTGVAPEGPPALTSSSSSSSLSSSSSSSSSSLSSSSSSCGGPTSIHCGSDASTLSTAAVVLHAFRSSSLSASWRPPTTRSQTPRWVEVRTTLPYAVPVRSARRMSGMVCGGCCCAPEGTGWCAGGSSSGSGAGCSMKRARGEYSYDLNSIHAVYSVQKQMTHG